MTTIYDLELSLIRMSQREIIEYVMINQHIHREKLCKMCNSFFSFVRYTRNKDGFSWRCMTKKCPDYKKYSCLRIITFFENFQLPLLTIYQIILRYGGRTPRYAMLECFNINKKTIYKIINEIIYRMPSPDFSCDKLGGNNRIVQIDETMLNYKCKSHRGRSSHNLTDALCIVEVERGITRVFACVIPNKQASTIVSIICSQVAVGSIIWTDEHRSYSRLSSYNYVHDSVCHKYNFVNNLTGANTQAVESFNNILKLEKKARKGVKTEERSLLLKEICFFFNNSQNLICKLFELIKFC